MRSPVTTHVLDTSKGKPAQGLRVALEILRNRESGADNFPANETWEIIGSGRTDADGRVSTLLPPDHKLQKAVYRINFDTGSYQKGFYPSVSIVFEIAAPDEHYHVPLLLNPYGYSTYRGS